jgi:hypothetical protein
MSGLTHTDLHQRPLLPAELTSVRRRRSSCESSSRQASSPRARQYNIASDCIAAAAAGRSIGQCADAGPDSRPDRLDRLGTATLYKS